MPEHDLVIHASDLGAIESTLQRLHEDANATFAFLIDRNGQQLACVGETEKLDATSLASLTAGNVTATEGLAKLIGEPAFSSLFHEGERDNMLITLIGDRVILVLAFDERSSLGLVRLRVRQASGPLAQILEGIDKRSAEHGSPLHGPDSAFGEITDDDIDNLFAE